MSYVVGCTPFEPSYNVTKVGNYRLNLEKQNQDAAVRRVGALAGASDSTQYDRQRHGIFRRSEDGGDTLHVSRQAFNAYASMRQRQTGLPYENLDKKIMASLTQQPLSPSKAGALFNLRA